MATVRSHRVQTLFAAGLGGSLRKLLPLRSYFASLPLLAAQPLSSPSSSSAPDVCQIEIVPPPTATSRTQSGGSQLDPQIHAAFNDVGNLDAFARARVTNFIRRVKDGGGTASPSSAASDDSSLFDVKEIKLSDGTTQFHAKLKLELPGNYPILHGEGVALLPKDAEVLSAMHAEWILDELGFQIFSAASKQKKHAESARQAGRWAPMPEDTLREFQSVSLPPPLRRVLTYEETEGGQFQLLSAKVKHYRTPMHTLLSTAVVDPNSAHRIRKYFQDQKKSFEQSLSIAEVASASEYRMVSAQIALPLPPEYGRVVAQGKAADRQLAVILACMHAELVIDALGLPLFSLNAELQVAHATAARAFGRKAPLAGEAPAAPGSPIPPALKQYIPFHGAKRVAPPSYDERLVQQHESLIESARSFENVEIVDKTAMEKLREFLLAVKAVRIDPYFTEKIGSTFRSTVVLPLPEECGVRGGVGIGDTVAIAESLAAMHALEVINALGFRVHADDAKHQQYVGARREQQRPVGEQLLGSLSEGQAISKSSIPSPPALRKLSQGSGDADTKPKPFDAQAARKEKREQQLRQMNSAPNLVAAPTPTPNAPVAISASTSIATQQPTGAPQQDPQIDWKAQQKNVERHHWCLDPDTEDGFIFVSPQQSVDNSVSFGHTLVSPRQIDMLARERVVAYCSTAGQRANRVFETLEIPGEDSQAWFRSRIWLPLPAEYGERYAVGEAPDPREAELLAAMHAELTLDTLGIPLYTDPAQQKKHADAARRMGRYAPVPKEPARSPYTRSPPGLRKPREDSVRWLRHVQKTYVAGTKVNSEDTTIRNEAATISFASVAGDTLDSAAKSRVINYLRRACPGDIPEPTVSVVGQNEDDVVHTARLDVPVPPHFGRRIAMGVAPARKDADVLCYMHAERVIDALGVHLFALPGLQKRHAEQAKLEGRWAAQLDEHPNIDPATPSPPALRIDTLGPGVRYPACPTGPLKAQQWEAYVSACEAYIDSVVKLQRADALKQDKVPRTGDPLVDDALDEVDRSELNRNSKADLYNYCFKANLTYPANWKSRFVGPQTLRRAMTSIEVPGYEHITAMGIAASRENSQRKAAMHAMALLRRLDPDFAHYEFGTEGVSSVKTKAQRRQDQGAWDRFTHSFTFEGKVRAVELYTLCRGLPAPQILHLQKAEGKFVSHSTTVQFTDVGGEVYKGEAQDAGRKANEAQAFDDLFFNCVDRIPAFRSLMQLLKAHPHLDPEHIMSVEIPDALQREIGALLQRSPLLDGSEGTAECAPVPAAVPREERPLDTAGQVKAKQDELKRRLVEKRAHPEYKSKFEVRRETLSIHNHKQAILDAVRSNRVVILCGTTGCGKTTQVPQYLLDEETESGHGGSCKIVITQPRRISAISIAQRVAAERLEGVGDAVGYMIRLESRPGRHINFCTSGVLLRMFQENPNLDDLKYVLIDEIHERDIHTDFSLILVRELVRRRPDVRVVLMSATLQSSLFSEYFDNAPVINVEGHVYPVRELFLEDLARLAEEKGAALTQSMKEALTPANPGSTSQPQQPDDDEVVVASSSAADSRYGFQECLTPIDYNALVFAVEHVMGSENQVEGSVLVFLPGWDEIMHAKDHLLSSKYASRYYIIVLHSTIKSELQLECFMPPPPGKTKVILSTNIAESGVTIDDVTAVIDAGRLKEKSFVMRYGRTSVGRHERGAVSQLVSIFASRANCIQRRGRAGRTRPGVCLRLFTRQHFQGLHEFQTPEMLRHPLDSLNLQILALGLGDPAEFLKRAPEPPPLDNINSAMMRLGALGAVNEDRQLTSLGQWLSRLPVVPRVGKMILIGATLKCLDSVLTVASCTNLDPFLSTRDVREAVRVNREDLARNSNSDHIATLNAYNTWATHRAVKTPAELRTLISSNTLNDQSLQVISKFKQQFFDVLAETGFLGSKYQEVAAQHEAVPPVSFVDTSSYSQDATNIGLVKAALSSGLYPNVALWRDHRLFRTKLDNAVHTSPNSVVHKIAAEDVTNPFFVYEEIVKAATDSRLLFRGASNVSMWAILLLGATNEHIMFREDLCLALIDEWIVLRITAPVLNMICHLKAKFNQSISRKFVAPDDADNNKVLNELQSILKQLVNLPTKPNNLVSVTWEDKGEISEAVSVHGASQIQLEEDGEPSSVVVLAPSLALGNDDADESTASSEAPCSTKESEPPRPKQQRQPASSAVFRRFDVPPPAPGETPAQPKREPSATSSASRPRSVVRSRHKEVTS